MGHFRTIKVQADCLLPLEISPGNRNRIRYHKLEKLLKDRRMATEVIKRGHLKLSAYSCGEQE